MPLLYENDSYQVHQYPFLPERARLFLNQIQWGKKGTRYRRPVTIEAAARLHRPWAFVIQSPQEVLGTVVANQYTFLPETDGYYFRYFASHPERRGQAILGVNAKRVMNWLALQLKPTDFCYAFLEKKNEPSLRMVQHLGFRPYQTSHTVGFSRFYPKKDPQAQQITHVAEQQEITELLKRHYQDHAFLHTAGWHYHQQYFVLKENNRILAGLQVIPAEWELTQMEGWLGTVLMTWGHQLPLIRRIFNPKKFRFLAFEGIYVAPGKEKELIRLMEHTLAVFQTQAALFWQDPTSPYYLGNRKDLGLLNPFVQGTGSYLMAQNLPEAWKTKPAYISCFDFV